MNQLKSLPVLAFSTILLCGQPALAEVVPLTPSIDGVQTRTGFPFPTFTYNTTGASIQSSFSQVASHANVSINEQMLAMEFDLSSIAPGSLLISAILSWTERSDFLSPGNTHSLIGAVGDGVLNTANYNGTNLGIVSNGVNDGLVSFDVTFFLADRLAAADHYVSFAVNNGGYYQTSSGPFSSVTIVSSYSIASRLDANPNARPQLVLTVIPEAQSYVMAGLACLGFIVFSIPRSRVRSAKSI